MAARWRRQKKAAECSDPALSPPSLAAAWLAASVGEITGELPPRQLTLVRNDHRPPNVICRAPCTPVGALYRTVCPEIVVLGHPCLPCRHRRRC